MIDPFSLLADSVTIFSVFYSAYSILKSHMALGGKIDELVKVVQTHQVALDQAGKDIQQLRTAAMNH